MATHIESCGVYTPKRKRRATTPPSPRDLELYEDYFNTAERANRSPLPFEAWRLMAGL